MAFRGRSRKSKSPEINWRRKKPVKPRQARKLLRKRTPPKKHKLALAILTTPNQNFYSHIGKWKVLFKGRSFGQGLRILQRLLRWKQSVAARLKSGRLVLSKKKSYRKRDYHHLNPRSRGGRRWFRANLLLIGKKRHKALHLLFKRGSQEMNLEEIIQFLQGLEVLGYRNSLKVA